MNDSVRRKALRHAAKVAFGSLIAGCGGGLQDAAPDAHPKNDVQVSDVQNLDAQNDAADASDDVIVDVVKPPWDGSLACTGPITDFDASVDEPTFQCCLGVVEQVTGDSGFTVVDAGAISGDPSVANCCDAIIAHVDQMSSDYGAASPTLPSCCNYAQHPTGVACTPWGPPMPPAVPYEWLAIRSEAA
jgi:hypothetical protein